MREMKNKELEFVTGGISLPAPAPPRGILIPPRIPVPIPFPIDPIKFIVN
jgi:hypothetical protein